MPIPETMLKPHPWGERGRLGGPVKKQDLTGRSGQALGLPMCHGYTYLLLELRKFKGGMS
jgi:hypothetical protein